MRALCKPAWETFLDLVTLVWFVVFGASLAGFSAGWLAWVTAAIGAVFVIDLVRMFFASKSLREFWRRAWLDLLLLVPFFRIFRVKRVARLFRIRRLSRLFRADHIHHIQAGIEGLDLVQKSLERIRRLV